MEYKAFFLNQYIAYLLIYCLHPNFIIIKMITAGDDLLNLLDICSKYLIISVAKMCIVSNVSV